MLIFSERHLLSVLAEYARHYNRRRPHRSRQLHPPRPDHPIAGPSQERIKRRPLLGGLISEYERLRRSPVKTAAEFWHPAPSRQRRRDGALDQVSGDTGLLAVPAHPLRKKGPALSP